MYNTGKMKKKGKKKKKKKKDGEAAENACGMSQAFCADQG